MPRTPRRIPATMNVRPGSPYLGDESDEGPYVPLWRPERSTYYWAFKSLLSSRSQTPPPPEANGEAAEASTAPTTPPPVAKRERRSSICESIVVSWPKPGKVAVLGYGNRQLAEEECASFNGEASENAPRKLLCGHQVTAIMGPEAPPRGALPDGAPQAPQPSRAASKVTVFFGRLPNTSDSALRRQIRTGLKPGPRQVDMVEYTATIEETRVAVETLAADVAPVEAFYMFDDCTNTRLEAVVCFEDVDDALKAYRQLNNMLLPCLPEGKLRVRLHDVNDTGVRCHKRP